MADSPSKASKSDEIAFAFEGFMPGADPTLPVATAGESKLPVAGVFGGEIPGGGGAENSVQSSDLALDAGVEISVLVAAVSPAVLKSAQSSSSSVFVPLSLIEGALGCVIAGTFTSVDNPDIMLLLRAATFVSTVNLGSSTPSCCSPNLLASDAFSAGGTGSVPELKSPQDSSSCCCDCAGRAGIALLQLGSGDGLPMDGNFSKCPGDDWSDGV